MKQIFRTHSSEETRAIGQGIGAVLKPGDVIALVGELGAGKTCLAQGIARGAGIASHEVVNSPSYTLINEYSGKVPIFHIDLYRLKHRNEIADLGLEEYLEGDGICIIEWGNRISELLTENHIHITITWIDESTRTITVKKNMRN